ncbi:Uncharacterized protein TCAP_06091, partial [Tolypocladium capitatum]
MTDPRVPAKPSSHLPSAVSSSVRPRNRHVVSSGEDDDVSGPRPRRQDPGLPSAYSASTSRTASPSPQPPGRFGTSTSPNRGAGGAGTLAQFLGDSWTQSWSSVQGFASTLLSVGGDPLQRGGGGSQRPRSRSRGASRPGDWDRQHPSSSTGTGKNQVSWGPAPPSRNPGLVGGAAGSLAERETALKAARTASVLESHDGVNGGLDVTGKHKRRNSDEVAPESSQLEDCLVYVHPIQPDDTYAGLILRYKCREDVFRKANGLWSRDSIQTRKWLALPVDACEIRGRPCEAPSWHNSLEVDLLAPTPTAADDSSSSRQVTHGDFFSGPPNGGAADDKNAPDEDTQWTHVRWVQIDSFRQPVQIGRVARQALGYFPPRRKKSIRTASSLSTPRQSSDLCSIPPSSLERPSLRRQSSLSSRPQLSGTPVSSRSRVGSDTADGRPAWMRRPGGVGSMGRSIRAPGPDKDYFNSWTSKHLPGLNIAALPSMSVMGSETARFGFASGSSGIVESPFEDGRDTASASRQGSGLDRAAAAVESWLRGALAKRPGTPLMGSRARSTGLPAGRDDGDLIELADTGSEDGSLLMHDAPTALLDSLSLGTGSRADGDGSGQDAHQRAQSRTRQMPICIECRHPVRTLWTQYSGAGDKSSGHNIRLTVCRKCGRFCDKYVEHDFVVLFIDLVLIKPQVYRHLLHNTLMRDGDRFDPSIIRLGVLLLLFDVYLTWARIEKQTLPASTPGESNLGRLAQQPIVLQYLFFLMLCALSTLAFHLSIRFLASSPLSPLNALRIMPRHARPNSVSTALLVSSSTKLFPILMVIWEYDVPAAARSLGWAVVANNVEALRILLDCKYYTACILAIAGAASRWAVGRMVLTAAGLGDVDSIDESSVAADGKALWALLMYA